jgi:hypothetical protein
MKVELLRDATRESGWWLLVEGSEQSYVDTADPRHLEFEYVQLASYVIESAFPEGTALSALHLGGGLCTLPRWLSVVHPGSRQRVVEHSAEIAKLCISLGRPKGVKIVIDDALDAVSRARASSVDLLVCDVYDGPETVTTLFTRDAIGHFGRVLRPEGLFVANVSDATPFEMSRVVAAGLLEAFADVVLLAEPPVLRGRRSGNLVVAATNGELPTPELARRAAGGPVRARPLSGANLDDFVGGATPAASVDDIPMSGESSTVTELRGIGRRWVSRS